MYIEFVPMYIGLVLNIVLTIITLVFVIKNKSSGGRKNEKEIKNNGISDNRSLEVISICKKCAAQYDTNLKKCPNCGTPKK